MSYFIGIDLGTSNSSLAYVVDGPRRREQSTQEVHELKFEYQGGRIKSTRLPSLIGRERTTRNKSQTQLGWPVLDRLLGIVGKKTADECVLGRDVLRSFKSAMGTNRVFHASRIEGVRTPLDAAALVLEQLMQELKEQLDLEDVGDLPVVVTVPASFSQLARDETAAAAIKAGLRNLSFIDEPVAAVVDCLNSDKGEHWLSDGNPKNILVFDYGGGTCDLSLVRARLDGASASGVEVVNLAISNYLRLGGDDVDRAVMEHVIWPQIIEALEERGKPTTLESEVKSKLEELLTFTVARELKERMSSKLDRHSKGTDEWGFRVGGREEDVVVATEAKQPIPFLGHSFKLDYRMTALQFREVMSEFTRDPRLVGPEALERSLIQPVLEVLRKAEMEPGDLDYIVLHGGATRNPLVEGCLEEYILEQPSLFVSTAIVSTPDRETSVARGAALACYFGHARKHTYVQPIMPEDLGVLAKDDRPVVVIKAGTKVPFPENGIETVDTLFFVQRDNQRELLVPLFVGTPDRLAAVIRMSGLPAGLRAGTEVVLKYSIDVDKRVKWWVSVAGGADWAAQVISSPWTAHPTTRASRELMELRRLQRESLARGQALGREAQRREISLMYHAARSESEYAELFTRMAEFEAEFGNDALLHNDRARALGELGRTEEGIEEALRALDLAPDDEVLAGNLGMALASAGRHEEGLGYLRMASQQFPYVYPALIRALQATGRSREVEATARAGLLLARKWTARSPDEQGHWMVVARMATVLGLHKERDEALAHLRRLGLDEKLDGDSRDQIASEDSGFFYSAEDSDDEE